MGVSGSRDNRMQPKEMQTSIVNPMIERMKNDPSYVETVSLSEIRAGNPCRLDMVKELAIASATAAGFGLLINEGCPFSANSRHFLEFRRADYYDHDDYDDGYDYHGHGYDGHYGYDYY